MIFLFQIVIHTFRRTKLSKQIVDKIIYDKESDSLKIYFFYVKNARKPLILLGLGTLYVIEVRWTGWRIRSFFEIFFSEIYHAL